MIRPSATFRLAAVVALTVAALSLLGMALQYRLVAARLHEQTERLLAADLGGLAALYDQRRIIALREAIDYRVATSGGGEMLLLMDRQGQVLAGTRKAWPAALEPLGDKIALDPAVEFEDSGTRWLGVARELPGGFPLLVARSLGPVDGTLKALRRGILGLGVLMLAAGAGVGWLAAGRVMGRIQRVNVLADRVAAGDLAARLPGARSADEFGLQETHVHAMLDRIEALNRATHRLSDTIAHELRTPLNRMLQKLQDVQGQEEVTGALKAEMRQAIKVFDALLDISRAEADKGAGGLVPVDLSALVAEVWELYEPAAEDRGLVPSAEIAGGISVLGDRSLIAQLLSNLLDNALKYARPGDSLRVVLAEGVDRPLMTVADSGPGLPPEIAGEAFEPFVRGARDQAKPGHGLGLALVSAIAARHGARLSLPAVERGLTVQIAWPRLTV